MTQYREPNNPQARLFRFVFNDGTEIDVKSEGWPWTYKQWVCIANMDQEIQYRPASEIDHWKEVQS